MRSYHSLATEIIQNYDCAVIFFLFRYVIHHLIMFLVWQMLFNIDGVYRHSENEIEGKLTIMLNGTDISINVTPQLHNSTYTKLTDA